MLEGVPSLGDFEVQVLRLVWQKQPCTERRITELVQKDRPVARTTVLKTMQRLEEKGLLAREKAERGPIRYRAILEEQRVLPTLIRRFVERVLGGSTAPLAAYLAESDSGKLSAKDLEALETIASKIEQES
jgi:BlaI family transcriptional regulator, penicillinase repressor